MALTVNLQHFSDQLDALYGFPVPHSILTLLQRVDVKAFKCTVNLTSNPRPTLLGSSWNLSSSFTEGLRQ